MLTVRLPAACRLRLGTIKAIWRGLIKDVVDRYRPELHYMRGPGPKWRAKNRSEAGNIA